MSRRPWFKFFPSDWRGDANLRACSPLARGLWIEMVCLMGMAEPYGHLVVAGHPLTDDSLAQQAGMTPEDVHVGLAELEAAAVFNRDPAGTIYSRRMVHDEEVRRKRAEGGKESGKNPNVPPAKDTFKDTLKGYPSGGSPGPKDILEGPPQIPDARKDLKTSPTEQSGKKETWLSPFGDLWVQHTGGVVPWGQLAHYLKPLCDVHGADEALARLTVYLVETEPRFRSLARFAENFDAWTGGARHLLGPVPPPAEDTGRGAVRIRRARLVRRRDVRP